MDSMVVGMTGTGSTGSHRLGYFKVFSGIIQISLCLVLIDIPLCGHLRFGSLGLLLQIVAPRLPRWQLEMLADAGSAKGASNGQARNVSA